MDDFDLRLRRLTYRLFVDLGRSPSASEVASAGAWQEADVLAGWRRLHEQHALVLDRDMAAIRMANPFSAIPTQYRVHARDRWWYANCAWDAFGICAALDAEGRIETSCRDCGEQIVVEVHAQHAGDESILFHCLVPASHWWTDIVFT